ncbi:MAG: ribonuclease H-like domain-containing protein, partial [Butyrivibrio sp.]|nr:ribonuclease H-like domain-containing protein [Butyrivibrio sp.]
MTKISEEITVSEKINQEAVELLTKLIECRKEEILFLDIETTGLSPKNSDIYLIGTGFFRDDHFIVRQFFAESSQDEEGVLSAFSDFSREFNKVVHFNGDRFDIPFLQYKYEEYKLSDPFERMESVDLYKIAKPFKTLLGLPDCKQTTLEHFLGIIRDDKYDGGRLISVYKDFVETRDSELLKLLMLHNAEDVKGMLQLLPILYFKEFFELFKNMPKISVRTDEDIDEAAYMQDQLPLPMRAIKVQANRYKDYEGKDKSEVYMKLVLPISLPGQLSGNEEGMFFKALGNEATLKVPLYETELKYFYSNYKEYYYLPKEDMAVHKSLAEFVDKNYREKAKPENCYTKKEGQYLMEWDLVFAPFFKRDYSDKSFFFDLNENMKK